ncbi:winged helix-turn-helix domain-containing protein [Pararhizobium sp. IMCC21322]|uniref:winged helix-turn-helix domain-containing protein n=1 Tax=Pararhizobium sp. IMCC21322 TaxID=3067903 RepID=UPI00274151D5|nr:winged helix-turn-helix domain-containing protein [Pararhizobium sp. IMCC21322]
MLPDRIYFLEHEIRPAIRQLLFDGSPITLGARAFDLLLYLIQHRDRIVSRAELMEQVWSGITVGDNNLNVQVSILRKLLGSQVIVTLPGRGLRFGLEVSVTPLIEGKPDLPLPAKPSVVVLPFTDLGVDPSLSWLPDSIVEDITTELSRFRNLFVVARNSAFTYREQPIDVRQVSRQLGVRYVVEGSVRTAPGRVRVTAQLIDAKMGGHVWAEKFEGPLDHHFDLQARIVGAVVTALAPQIDAAENAHNRTIQPVDLNAHGFAQRAWSAISAGEMKYAPAPRDDALMLAERALAINPNSSLAWRAIGWVQWWHAYHGTTNSREDTLKAGIAAASRAIAIDGSDHHAWRIKALLDFMNANPDQGLAGLRQAQEINPNCATTLAWLGMYEATHGNVAKGVPHVQSALRLSPRDPSRASFLVALGFAQFASRDYETAAQTSDAARLEAPDSATPMLLGTICWVGVGQIEKAQTLFKQLEGIAPKLVEARLAGRWLSTNPGYLKRAQTFLQIAAGLINETAAQTLR